MKPLARVVKGTSDLIRGRDLRSSMSRISSLWAETVAAEEEMDSPKRLLVFSVLAEWVQMSLCIAQVFAARGHEVTLAWLPHLRFGDVTPLSVKLYERWLTKGPQIDGGRVQVVNLARSSIGLPSSELIKEMQDQALIDTRYVIQREDEDLEGDPRHAFVYQRRLERDLHCAAALDSLMKENHFDLLITPHGGILEFGAAYRTARLNALPVSTFEFWDRRDTVNISTSGPTVEVDTTAAWAADEPHHLTPDREARVSELMKIREGTDWDGFVTGYQRAAKSDPDQLQSALNLDPTRPIALLCPNVAWDNLGRKPQPDRFPSMSSWMRETVQFFLNHDAQLVIRSHPAEALFGTGQSALDITREVTNDIPKNIKVIAPDDPTNTYGLMRIADLGLVYISTTGIEMAMRGIPVMCGGPAHYAGKGFTVETGMSTFSSDLDRQLSRPRSMDRRAVELAWCYADVYTYNWTHPFPWNLISMQNDLERWPLARVLSREGWSRYGPTFSHLAQISSAEKPAR